MNLRDALATLPQRLRGDSARLDVQVVLAKVLGKTRSWVLSHPEYELVPTEQAALAAAAARLEAGEPLPYVLGRWEFFGLEFEVNPQVLIPRPETELLVERAITWLAAHHDQRSALEIGVGSGCIAVALTHHVRDLRVLGSDVSYPALQVASRNASRHGVASRITFLQADLLTPFPPLPPPGRRFGLVVSNPPYIPTPTLADLPVAIHEPRRALDGGPGGLASIERLLRATPAWLDSPGCLLVEIERSQGEAVCELAKAHFPGASIQVHADLTGHDRMLGIEA